MENQFSKQLSPFENRKVGDFDSKMNVNKNFASPIDNFENDVD